MSTLSAALQFLFPDGRPLDDWIVAERGAGPYIARWSRPEPQPTAEELAAAEIPAAKAARIAAINAECRERILSVWPQEKQNSALAGIYGQANLEAMTVLIAGHIDASNAASDEINLPATDTVAKVEAVTVTWPAI